MYKFLTAVFAATLLSSTVLAEEKTITVPIPKSITIVCSDDVQPGTIVLSNPPKVSCQDYTLAKTLIGTDVTIGPDANVNQIVSALRRSQNRAQRKWDSVTENRRTRLDDPIFGLPKPPWARQRTDEDQPRSSNDDYFNQPRFRLDFDNHRPRVTRHKQSRGAWQSIDGVDDDFNPEFTKKFPGITRNREFFISGTSSCRGWVPVQDIIDGKCRNGKIKVD